MCYIVNVVCSMFEQEVTSVHISSSMPHLLSDPGLILATVEAATGCPGPEPNVTFPSVAWPLVLSRDLHRKLGKASSSNL